MSSPFLYIVKSWVSKEHAREYNDWYHHTHIPQVVQASGCIKARRFQAVETEDKFLYMAIYEFADEATFLKYQDSQARKELIADSQKTWGTKAETKKSVWKQIYP